MGAIKGLTLWNEHEAGKVIIHVRGELDFATTPHLVQAIKNLTDESINNYVINCQEVTFIDSETLKHVLSLKRDFERNGRNLGFQYCNQQIRRILDLLGLSEQLVIDA